MKNRSNKGKIFSAISTGVIVGFSAGTVFSFHEVITQHYFQYQMFRLICLSLQKHLNKWTLISILLFLCGSFVLTLFPHRKSFSISQTKRLYDIKKISFSLLALLLCLNLGIIIEPVIKKPPGPNILLIVIDCLRPDHLGCYGYGRNTSPAIDSLAARGALFKNAYSNAPWTKPSVATIFTSLYPNDHNVVNSSSAMPDGILTMAEILKNSGYNTFFFNGGNAFLKKKFNFDQGFETCTFRDHKTTNADAITDDFLAYIQSLNKKNFFAYLHYMDAHAPYTKNDFNYLFTRTINNRFQPGDRNGGLKYAKVLTLQNRLSDADKRYIVSLYDGQIRFIDENINRIFKFLKQSNLLKNTVIIITSDHGEEFWEHDNFEHGHSLYNELLKVPLIIFGSKIQQGVITDNVRLIDLLPTVMQICNIKSSMNFRGLNFMELLNGKRSAESLPVFASGTLYGAEKYCLIKGGDKIIQNTNNMDNKWNLIGYASPYRLELYNLQTDPLEKNNLGENYKKTAELQKELDAFKNTNPLFQKDTSCVVIDGDIKEKLGALGYVQ